MLALLIASVFASPLVKDSFKKFDAGCAKDSCGPQLHHCAEDRGSGEVCSQRLACAMHSHGNVEACFHKVTWSDLDDTEIKVLDCAHTNDCMPDEHPDVSSFIQEENKRRGLVPASSLMEEGDSMSAEEMQGVATKLIAAHLEYIKQTGQLVQKTHAMMQHVIADKTMTHEEKLGALHMLKEHLKDLKGGAREAIRSLGIDPDEIEGVGDKDKDEHSSEEEEPAKDESDEPATLPKDAPEKPSTEEGSDEARGASSHKEVEAKKIDEEANLRTAAEH